MSAELRLGPTAAGHRFSGAGRAGWLLPLLPLLVGIAVLAIGPQIYTLKVAVLVALGALQAVSLNIIWGYGGQFSMGQITLSAVGAYASALSVTLLGFNPWVAALPALGMAVVFTLLFGALALRLKGFYFSIVTLAFAQLIAMVLYNADFAGGPSGMTVPYAIPDIVIAGRTLLHMDAGGYLIVSTAILSVVLAGTVYVARRRMGRAIVAVREEETLAQAIGIDPTRCKIIAFLMSSVPAALAGWLMAPFVAYLSPVGFGLEQLLDQICMVVIGGAGTVLGPLVGALVVVLIPELLRFAGALRIVAYSVVLILVVIFARDGLVGVAKRRLRILPGTARPAEPPPSTEATPSPWLRESEKAEAASPRTAGGALLQVSGLTKRFAGLVAVSSVSLELRAGELVGLIGPNGAGKTTLFDMISGFAAPTQGQVRWQGEDITAVPPQRRAQRGMVRTFQHARVFPRLTARENLMTATHLPARGLLGTADNAERVERVLALCHLKEWGDSVADQLPYGVSKRLGVALGLIAEPHLLMLDEPAAGLTPPERKELLATLRQIGALGLTLLIIEHDVEFVMGICPRIIVLSAGQVIADAGVEEIRRDPAVIEAYLGTPGGAIDTKEAGHAAS